MSAAMEHTGPDEGCIGLAVRFRNQELGFDWSGPPHDILLQMARAGINVGDAADHLQTSISMRKVFKPGTSFAFHGGPHAEGLMNLMDALVRGSRGDTEAVLNEEPAILTDDYDDAALPLIVCSAIGDTDVVRVLLDRGARVNRADEMQMTALHWAAVFGHSPIASALIEAGADVSLRSRFLLMAAHLAQLNSHPELATKLAGGISVPKGGALMLHIMEMMRNEMGT